MIKNLKELFPNYVVMIKIGTFYEVYYADAYIISYLLGYKLKTLNGDVRNCGFPTVSLNKVLYILDNKKINYLVVDKSDNYAELNKNNFKNKNKYIEIYEMCKEEIDLKLRIEKIYKYLLNNKNKVKQIEEILYEQ